jgi:hypothetical protein
MMEMYFRLSSVIVVLVFGLLSLPVFGQSLQPTYCTQLQDSTAKRYCVSYINNKSSEGKWVTAVEWAKYRAGSCELLIPGQRVLSLVSTKCLHSCVPAHWLREHNKSLLLLGACSQMCQHHGYLPTG